MNKTNTAKKATKRLRKPKPGDFIQIELPNGYFAYGRAIKGPMCAFYDVISSKPVSIEELKNAKVLFIIWVMYFSFKKPTWSVIGHSDLPPSLTKRVWFWKKDSISGELTKYSTWNGVTEERRTNKKGIEGLECAAVWDPEHVEDRFVSHLEGKPCKWLNF